MELPKELKPDARTKNSLSPNLDRVALVGLPVATQEFSHRDWRRQERLFGCTEMIEARDMDGVPSQELLHLLLAEFCF
jgi:hypothetical protein